MFVDVVVKYKGETERVTATIGQDSNYFDNIQQSFIDHPDLEYIRLEMSTYVALWLNKLEEQKK